MATIEKIKKVLMAWKTVWSVKTDDTDPEDLVKLWGFALNDLTDEEVNYGFSECLKNCKFAPTPAHIREEVRRAKQALLPSPSELWEAYRDGLKKTQRYAVDLGIGYVIEGKSQHQRAMEKINEVFEGLPMEVGAYLGSAKELIRMANSCCLEEQLNFEKSKFTKSIPEIRERLEIGEKNDIRKRIETH